MIHRINVSIISACHRREARLPQAALASEGREKYKTYKMG
jgi:hypothetical protein